MSSDSQIFVGRQPILDRCEHVVAYEILFRGSATDQTANFSDAGHAAVHVIAATFGSMGVEAVLGDKLAFLNVTEAVLLSDMIEALPRERVVIELLESTTVNPSTMKRCEELHKNGFTLALDDYVFDDPREPLLDLVQLVKIDLPLVSESDLGTLVRQLRRRSVKILAEKVETLEEFRRCEDLGIDLFQGYYFARPTVLESASLDPARVVLVELLNKLIADADQSVIEETLKQNVNLGVNLLRLVNSAAMGAVHKIGRVQDAVCYLGRRQLQRWITILLYAGTEPDGIASPLLQTAAHRGRIMELMSQKMLDGGGNASEHDRAFLVGMLSLVDALLHRPLEEILGELNVEDEIRDALLKRDGVVGQLLRLAEAAERLELDCIAKITAEFGLSLADVQQAEYQAYNWVHSLAVES